MVAAFPAKRLIAATIRRHHLFSSRTRLVNQLTFAVRSRCYDPLT
jgi:hypothetical protein